MATLSLQIFIGILSVLVVGWLINQLPNVEAFPGKNALILRLAFEVITLLAIYRWGIDNFPTSNTPTTNTLHTIGIALITLLIVDSIQLINSVIRTSFISEDEIDEGKENIAFHNLRRAISTEISDRLQESLHSKPIIELQVSYRHQLVGKSDFFYLSTNENKEEDTKLEKIFIYLSERISSISKTKHKKDSTSKILDIYNQEDISEKLLILGTPGAGKTTFLLQLAKELLKDNQLADKRLIPVILELSGRKDSKVEIDEWFAEQLNEYYKIPKPLARRWIDRQEVIFLLDGLDELDPSAQQKCILDINWFLSKRLYPYLAVCCRFHEYKLCKTQLNMLNGAVYLEPLTEDQIRSYLQKLNMSGLWNAIQDNSSWRELSKTPFFLNLIISVYQKESNEDVKGIIDEYIHEKIAQKRFLSEASNKEKEKEVLLWLTWLARLLREESMAYFSVDALQPRLIKRKEYRLLYHFLDGLLTGFSAGAVVGFIDVLIFTLLHGIRAGVFAGVMFGTITGIAFGLTCGFFLTGMYLLGISREDRRIPSIVYFSLVGALTFALSYLAVFKSTTQNVFWGTVDGIIYGLIFGASTYLGDNIEIFDSFEFSSLNISKKDMTTGAANAFFGIVIGGLIGYILYRGESDTFYCMVMGALYGFAYGILDELRKKRSVSAKSKHVTNQGVLASARNAVFVTLICWLLFTPSFILLNRNNLLSINHLSILFGCLGGGVWAGVVLGGRTCLQHFSLRITLWRQGVIPWNYERFLDYASERKILQKTGGRYRFLHSFFENYFVCRRSEIN